MVESWASRAIEGFKFCPKFFRSISHYKRLKGAEEVTEAFLYIMNSFGDYLGPSFLQLSENFSPQKFPELEQYIKQLPTDIQIAVELRHPGWYTDKQIVDEVFDLMAHYNKCMVITDTAGRRGCIHQRLTTPMAFIRFNGYDLHPSDFARIDEWVERLGHWVDDGLETVFYFAHQDDECHTPVTCDYFIKAINKRLGLDVKAPQFID